MTGREKLARAGVGLAGLVCLALAAAVGGYALDLARWDGAIADDDARFRTTTETQWAPSTVLPAQLSRVLLGVGDDVELRRAIRAVRLARLDDAVVSDPSLALARNEAQARLEAIASGRMDRARRSRAAGLLGALVLAQLATETQDRDVLLEYAISSLQRAIALDPENAEAKLHLELALQRGRSIQLEEAGGGRNPSPGGSGSRGAGAGDAGSGY